MKGFCKGFNKYISNMFATPKEPEMQIGGPTDVKHVAHIGWDGGSASATPPTWMGEFKTGPEFSAPAVPAGSGTRGTDASNGKWTEEGAETTGRQSEGHHKKHRRKKGKETSSSSKPHRGKKGKSKQTNNGGQTSNQPDL